MRSPLPDHVAGGAMAEVSARRNGFQIDHPRPFAMNMSYMRGAISALLASEFNRTVTLANDPSWQDSLELPRRALRDLLAGSRHAVSFTGAGISTECGVPDFRSPGSPWLIHKPIDFGSFKDNREMRAEAWRRKFAIDALHSGARPGKGHRAIAHLVATGCIRCVITQNIDGLHQASGVDGRQLIELHGNGTYARCLSCGERHELADIKRRFEVRGDAPECHCGGPIKSATIAFGQAVPEAEMRRAQAETLACDLFVVIGSSLVVYPAAALPKLAKRNGARLVILNRTPTTLDESADLVIRADIGTLLGPFAAE